jgi:hypothetical protein
MENMMLPGLSLKIRVADWSFRSMRFELLSAPHGDMPRTRELDALVCPLKFRQLALMSLVSSKT